MQGVVPVFEVHLLSQKPVSLHHDQRIAGLHAEQEVVVIMVPAQHFGKPNERPYEKGRLQARRAFAPLREISVHGASDDKCLSAECKEEQPPKSSASASNGEEVARKVTGSVYIGRMFQEHELNKQLGMQGQ